MFSDSDEFVVPTSRIKLAALALGAIAFVVIGVWLFVRDGSTMVVRLVGVFAAAFFGFCGAYAVWRLVRPTPAVVINRNGVFDHASALGVGLIPWAEIAEVREYTFNGQTFLGIVPKDLNALLLKQPTWKRSAIRANLALGAAPVNIPQTMLPVPVADLLREINTRFQR